jgi:hypothetical protein
VTAVRRAARLLVAIVLLATAAPAVADTELVDFEAIPAGQDVTDQYRADTGLYFEPGDPEWLPTVTDVGAQAHSGTKVGDIFRCPAQGGPNCEGAVSATRGRFETSVSSVQVRVGMFSSGSSNTTVTLHAYDGGGAELAAVSTDVAPGAGFHSLLAYTSATPNIASFRVDAPNSATGPIGIDDISFETPATPPPPDFGLTVDLGSVTLRQGTSVDIPITINRVNGSTGDIAFAASGLPDGVSAEFLPNPATGNALTMRLTASDTAAAPGPGEPIPEITVTATPSPSAGSQPRSFTKLVRVGRNFDIEIAGGATAVALPSCLQVDVPVQIIRGSEFTGTVDLAASFPTNPAGIGATLLPASVPYAGLGIDTATLRLRVPTALPLNDRELVVTGTSSGVPAADDLIVVDRIAQSVAPSTGLGRTPRRMSPGTEITFTGGGFCPGSKVQFGHDAATSQERADLGPQLLADATSISADGAEMRARVPRLGTTGKIRVLQPGGPDIESSAPFTVESYRGTGGFAFDNFPWGNFSFGEMTDLFGIDEMFVHVNLCWPWGNCPTPTGIPDPLSYIAWQVIEQALQDTGGHCFGISWAIQLMQSGEVPYGRFTAGATSPYEMADHTGPKNGLASYLDTLHGGQATEEFIDFYFDRTRTISDQLAIMQDELSQGRQPAVTVRNEGNGHVMTVYDLESAPDGTTNVYVYDNNHPWVPRDTGPDGTGPDRNELTRVGLHARLETDHGRIKIDAAKRKWTFDNLGWSGGGGTLIAIPHGVIPDDPTLPLSGDPTTVVNLVIMFGGGGSAATGGLTGARSADFLPALDSAATPGSGTHIARGGGGPVTHRIRGRRRGRYREALMLPGFVAALQGVPTAKGVDDAVVYDTDKRSAEFTGEMDRPLTAQLAGRTGAGDSHTAAVKTKTFEGGSDAFEIGGRAGRLVYSHKGPATSFSVSLGRAGRRGLPGRFESGPLRIGRGGRAVFKPVSWRRLDRVRATFIDRRGRRRTRVLRDRSRFDGRFAIKRLSVREGADGRRTLALRARFSRVEPNATALAAFRVRRGKRTVARRAVAATNVRRGRRALRATLQLPRGRYRLTGYLTLTRAGAVPDSRTRTRSLRFRVR